MTKYCNYSLGYRCIPLEKYFYKVFCQETFKATDGTNDINIRFDFPKE